MSCTAFVTNVMANMPCIVISMGASYFEGTHPCYPFDPFNIVFNGISQPLYRCSILPVKIRKHDSCRNIVPVLYGPFNNRI